MRSSPPALLPSGAHSIAASYSGDASYNKSSSTPGTVAFTVSKQRPQVAVSAAVSTIAQGQTTTLTALVQTLGGGVAPTGSVTFLAGSTTLGTGTVSAFENSYGVATYTITSAQSTALPVGRGLDRDLLRRQQLLHRQSTASPGTSDRNRRPPRCWPRPRRPPQAVLRPRPPRASTYRSRLLGRPARRRPPAQSIFSRGS